MARARDWGVLDAEVLRGNAEERLSNAVAGCMGTQ